MNERLEMRSIALPAWMDCAVSELAAKDKCAVDSEINSLVKAALETCSPDVHPLQEDFFG
jgi:hypothetical protein